MDQRPLTVAEVASRLARVTRPSAAWLRELSADPRRGVRRLVARYERTREFLRAERRRLWGLYREERGRRRAGQIVAGVDEVGCGCLAGPVVAAAVILTDAPPIAGLDDSKRLTPASRERLNDEIRSRALAVAVALASVEEIARLNIRGAARLAMRRAVESLSPSPDFALVDGRDRLTLGVDHATIVRGDAACACIAAASIVAKVARDRLMQDLDAAFPGYGFVRHKGYGTAEHLAALLRFGPCPAHRGAFLPVARTALFEWL